jgi:hypothetical protein
MYETYEISGTYNYNIYVKHMQYLDKTLAACNKKHLLQHNTGIAETFGTYSCNICAKHMQHP